MPGILVGRGRGTRRGRAARALAAAGIIGEGISRLQPGGLPRTTSGVGRTGELPATRGNALAIADGETAQRTSVDQLHQPPLHLDHAFALQACELTTYRFQLEPEVAPDLFARHS
jgi:hypothetical protein